MHGFELELHEYIYVLVGLSGLLGLIIYVMFYDLFQRFGGRRVVDEIDDVGASPVMSGLYVSRPSFPSIKKIVVDILNRSWKNVSSVLEKSAWSIFRDWYVIGYLILALIVLLSLIMGW